MGLTLINQDTHPRVVLLYHWDMHAKLQALVYDILPSTTAVFSYAIGSRKLSANEQFFVGAQTVVSCYKQLKLYQMFVL